MYRICLFSLITGKEGDDAQAWAAGDPGHNEERWRNQMLQNENVQSESYNILLIIKQLLSIHFSNQLSYVGLQGKNIYIISYWCMFLILLPF